MSTFKTNFRNLAVFGLATVFTATAMAGFGRANLPSGPILPGDSTRTSTQAKPKADLKSDAAYIYRLVGGKLPEGMAKTSDAKPSGKDPAPAGGASGEPKPKLPDYNTD